MTDNACVNFTHLFFLHFVSQLLVDELLETLDVALAAVLLGLVEVLALLEEFERRVSGDVVLGAQGRLDRAVNVGHDGLLLVGLVVLLGQVLPRGMKTFAMAAPVKEEETRTHQEIELRSMP